MNKNGEETLEQSIKRFTKTKVLYIIYYLMLINNNCIIYEILKLRDEYERNNNLLKAKLTLIDKAINNYKSHADNISQ